MEYQKSEPAKRTYSLPPDVVKDFEVAVPPGRRSAFVAGLLADWLEERRRSALREDIIACCKDMRDVLLETGREYYSLEEEVASGGAAPTSRRRRSSRS